jgi:PemK-like, MazF-like toxin of type II toxin-antitoxin system
MAYRGLRSQLARIIGRIFRLGRAGRRPVSKAHPGDFRGTPKISYQPNAGNGKVADPGEIVWTWVPFEEDRARGKDRPVLVIGHDGPWLLALPLTSKDHDHEAVAQARAHRQWTDIGSGPWDRRGRASAVRVDRILRVDPAQVRRQGAVLDRGRFRQVAAAVRALG